MRKQKSIIVLLMVMLTVACAVHKNPNLDPTTVWRLNTASQLQQLERDYRTLFTDVGNAQRAGTLTQAQVDQLNVVGNQLKPAIESANALFKAYVAAPADDKKAQIITAVLKAEEIFLQLSTKKTQLMTGGK